MFALKLNKYISIQLHCPSTYTSNTIEDLSPELFHLQVRDLTKNALLELLLAKSTGAGKVANDQAKLLSIEPLSLRNCWEGCEGNHPLTHCEKRRYCV